MEGNKLVWHLIGKKPFALKIQDFSKTPFKGEHPHGVLTIFAETFQIFASMQTLSKSPSVEKMWTKIFTHITDLHQNSKMQEPESLYLL